MARTIPVSPPIYGGRKYPAADNMGVRNGIDHVIICAALIQLLFQFYHPSTRPSFWLVSTLFLYKFPI